MEKIILFIIVIIKPNKDNSPILENFASHKKSTTSFFSLHLSPNPLQFIMIAFIKFPVIIIFLYTKISQKFVFIYWHSMTNAVVCLATVLDPYMRFISSYSNKNKPVVMLILEKNSRFMLKQLRHSL